MKDLNAEVPRVSAAVEWACGLNVPQEKIKEQVARFQELISECSKSASDVEPILLNADADLDEMRDALDVAISAAVDVLEFRVDMIQNILYWAPHPNKIKNSDE